MSDIKSMLREMQMLTLASKFERVFLSAQLDNCAVVKGGINYNELTNLLYSACNLMPDQHSPLHMYRVDISKIRCMNAEGGAIITYHMQPIVSCIGAPVTIFLIKTKADKFRMLTVEITFQPDPTPPLPVVALCEYTFNKHSHINYGILPLNQIPVRLFEVLKYT